MLKPYENPNGMTEIKPSLFALTAWWLSRHLILVGVIVAFILSLVGCQKAKAETLDEDWSIISSYDLPGFSQSNKNTTWENAKANGDMQYYIVLSRNDPFASAQSETLVCFTDVPGLSITFPFFSANYQITNDVDTTFTNGVYNTISAGWYYRNENAGYNAYQPYIDPSVTEINALFMWADGSSSMYACYVHFIKQYDYGYRTDSARMFGSTNYNATNYGARMSDFDCYQSNCDFYVTSRTDQVNNGYGGHYKFSPTRPIASYSDDSRLKFAKINSTYDGEILMTDIRQFINDFPIQDTSHSSVDLDPESITLTYTVDNTEKTIMLDSSNSTIRSKYIFETPIYEFDFDDDNTDVIITSATFTVYGTSQSAPYEQSETYMVSCSYPIRQLAPLPTPTPIPNPTYDDPEVVDASTVLSEITTQLTNDSTTTNAFTGEWTLDQEHPIVPSWADNYDFRVIKSDFNSIISGIVNKDIWNYYTSNDPDDYDWITGGFNPRNFVDENRNFAFYDMIIISVYEANIAWADGAVGTDLIYQNIHLLGYITLYSQRYYVHKSAITNNNILASIELAALNDVAYFETMKASIDQIEEYTLGRLDAQLDIEKDSLAWLKTISSKIDDIEPYNDTSLLSKLDSILAKLTQIAGTDNNEDDTVSEAIAYYKAHNDNGTPTSQVFTDNKMSIWLAGKVHFWLQGSSANEDKTGLLTASFNVLTSMYDSMKDEQTFFSSLYSFLNNLSGANTEPTQNENYMTFFFDSSFDPDTYEGVAVNE